VADETERAVSTLGAARPNRRKVREGMVISSSGDKTAVVLVVERVRHAKYAKIVQRSKRLYVHDEENAAAVGDKVLIAETRPVSKLKRWRLVKVLERAR
jgi:small subunit ribosomal protein S17